MNGVAHQQGGVVGEIGERADFRGPPPDGAPGRRNQPDCQHGERQGEHGERRAAR
jgi:hypothetical protein